MNSAIYLDHNATTPLTTDSRDAMRAFLEAEEGVEHVGNPSSPHVPGHRARLRLEEARAEVARLVGGADSGLVFTSGGTESDNLAILGHAFRVERDSGPGHIITTAIEHPAVLEPCAFLERRGWRVTRVPVDASGVVDPDDIRKSCGPETSMISVMLANNETGVVQPLAPISRMARDAGAALHVDAVQAAPWLAIDVGDPAVDFLSFSSHKMGGPGGIGALWVREGAPLDPLIRGGRQERGRRAGSEAILIAVGFAAAARSVRGDSGRADRARGLRDRFEGSILALAGAGSIPPCTVNGDGAPRLPNTSSLTFAGCDNEAVVIAMDLKGVALSTGSACSTGSARPSHVLSAMGLPTEAVRGTLRFSLGRETTLGMLEAAVRALGEVFHESPSRRVDAPARAGRG